jgi:hypothetical protein
VVNWSSWMIPWRPVCFLSVKTVGLHLVTRTGLESIAAERAIGSMETNLNVLQEKISVPKKHRGLLWSVTNVVLRLSVVPQR